MSQKNVTSTKGKETSTLSKLYLLLYNGIQTAGWGYVLLQSIRYLVVNRTYRGIWEVSGHGLIVFQSLAALEVLHSLLGLVPSSVVVTFMQIFSRVYQTWAILYPIPAAQSSPYLALTLITWGVTEVVRYSYYFMNLIGTAPYFLTWCRYSFFLLLYPLGVVSEFGNLLSGFETIRKQKLFYLLLPNRLNFSFNFFYFNIMLMLAYIPGFPPMFKHMLLQRKKILGSSQKGTGKKVN